MNGMRFCFGLALVFSAALAQAQGGQGGYGGAGISVQGGMQGPEGGENRQLFLSPGDRTEWEYDAKENEMLIVSITSDVFDPAVTVVDEKGAKLAENDDIEPGNQMARVLFVVPKEGKYKVVVTNYKGTAGGAFTFRTRRFLTYPVPFGTPFQPKRDPQGAWARVAIEKPGDYVVAIQTREDQTLRHMGPTGDELRQIDSYEADRGYVRFRFRAPIPGNYLFFNGQLSEIHVLPVESLTMPIGTTQGETLERNQIEDWTVPAKKDDVLEVKVTGKGENPLFALNSRLEGRSDALPYAVVQTGMYPPRYTLRMLRDGNVDIKVWRRGGEKTAYEMSVLPVGRPLPKGTELTSKLGWYGNDVWTFQGRVGDVVRFRASAETYLLNLTVMAPGGQTYQAESTGLPPDLTLPVQIHHPGLYVVYASGGGVGNYRLEYQTAEPRTLAADVSRGEIKGAPEVWRFRAEKGQDLAFRIASSTLHWDVVIAGPDGAAVGRFRYQGNGNDDFIRLKIKTSGDYTLTVTAIEGTAGPYQIKRIDLDR